MRADKQLIFSKNDAVSLSCYMKDDVEMTVKGRCLVLTRAQRFSDWLLLQVFRITGTRTG